jgi:hypothetical protein
MSSYFLVLISAAALSQAPVGDAKGGARATPGDYQTHAQMGKITLAADFGAHSVATPDAVYSTEDYVVVDAGFFGPPGTHLILNWQDFSLRINGKKTAIPAENVVVVYKDLKDPEWEDSVAVEAKSSSKTSIGGGGSSGPDSSLPPPKPKMPIALERKMEQRAEKAALPEGDRPLPEGGLLFFPYHGRTKDIRSIQLIYAGPAGKTTLALH